MRKLIGYSIIVLMISCTDRSKIPGDILQDEQWKLVLWDMIQAERFAQQFIKDSTEAGREIQKFDLYERVFAIHDITREEFIASAKFYLGRPDLTATVFDSLAAYGDRLKTQSYYLRGDSSAIKPL